MKRLSFTARLSAFIGLTAAALVVFFLAIYGAVRLAERFGIC
jgi:hypothetical protein